MPHDVDREERFRQATLALEEFFSRVESGEALTFEAWSLEHPQIADELRRLYAVCEMLRSGDSHVPPALDPPSRSAILRQALDHLLHGPNRFADYEIDPRPIAEGGMSTILAARDRFLRRPLAMKVLSVSIRDCLSSEASPLDLHRIARFLAEARVTSRLDHPAIVPIHELGIDSEGRPYFVMKRLRGRTLAEVLDRAAEGDPDWPRPRVLGLLHRVCEAVAFAHENGVIHRDLKPSNVMVGNFGEVYVMDWGLARVLESPEGDPCLDEASPAEPGHLDRAPEPASRDGEVLGTPAYMPPEQAEGRREEVGRHSDVYSVGAMLYQLLAGRPPYSEGTENRPNRIVLARVLAGPPEPLSRAVPHAPPELAAICERAMEREWRKRYPDMSALSADLSAFLEGRVVRAYEAGAWAEIRKWVRRNRLLAAALAASVVILIAGIVTSLIYAGSARDQADKALASARRANRVREFVEKVLAGSDPNQGGTPGTLVTDAMRQAVRDLESGALADDPATEAGLQASIAQILLSNGRADQALDLARKAAATQRRFFGGDHVELAISLDLVANSLRFSHRSEEALPPIEEALAMCRRLFETDDPFFAICIQDHAFTLDALGRSEEALRGHEEAVAMHRRLYAGDHANLANGMDGLARFLDSLGRDAEALPLHETVLGMRQRLYPADHPAVADALDGVGQCLFSLGRPSDALPKFQAALAMRERFYERDHPYLAMGFNHVGTTLELLDRHEEAIRSCQSALAMCLRLFEGDHSFTASCLDSVGDALDSLGRSPEALPMREEALDMYRRLYPADHVLVACALERLAGCLELNGSPKEARTKSEEASALYDRLTPVALGTLERVLTNLGVRLQARGRPDAALSRHEAALEMLRRLPPAEPLEIAKNLGNVGTCLAALGRNEEALPKLEESLAIALRAQPGESIHVATCLNNVAHVLDALGRAPEALPKYEAALEMYRRLFPGDHPQVANGLHEVAYGLGRLGRHAEALEKNQEALAMRRRLYDGDHTDLATSLGGVGFSLMNLARNEEAFAILEEGLSMKERLYPDGHEDVAIGLYNLARCLESMGKPAEALPYAERADAMAVVVFPEGHPFRAASAGRVDGIRKAIAALAPTDTQLPR